MRRFSIILVVLGILTVAGCDSVDERGRAAAAAAEGFLTAVDRRDGAAACAVLAPEIAADVEQSAGKPCPEAILEEDLPAPAAVTDTAVYGHRAQVRMVGDTIFLGAFSGGWRVVAAGCVARAARPYDCAVQGG